MKISIWNNDFAEWVHHIYQVHIYLMNIKYKSSCYEKKNLWSPVSKIRVYVLSKVKDDVGLQLSKRTRVSHTGKNGLGWRHKLQLTYSLYVKCNSQKRTFPKLFCPFRKRNGKVQTNILRGRIEITNSCSCIVAGYTTRTRIFCNVINNSGLRPSFFI